MSELGLGLGLGLGLECTIGNVKCREISNNKLPTRGPDRYAFVFRLYYNSSGLKLNTSLYPFYPLDRVVSFKEGQPPL